MSSTNMETNNSIVLIVVCTFLAGILGGLVVHELTPAPKQVVEQLAGASPVNATFNQQKQLAITMNLANGTTTSVQNNTSNDVFITTFNYVCTGVGTSQTAYTGAGLANLTVKAATTSTSLNSNTAAANTAVSNTNLSLTTSNIATSSTVTVVSSSTIADITPVFMDVPAGSWLTFITNATNTAVCTFASEYIGT